MWTLLTNDMILNFTRVEKKLKNDKATQKTIKITIKWISGMVHHIFWWGISKLQNLSAAVVE